MAAGNSVRPGMQRGTDEAPRASGRVRSWLITALVWGVARLFLIPFLWMISSSLKPHYQIF